MFPDEDGTQEKQNSNLLRHTPCLVAHHYKLFLVLTWNKQDFFPRSTEKCLHNSLIRRHDVYFLHSAVCTWDNFHNEFHGPLDAVNLSVFQEHKVTCLEIMGLGLPFATTL